MRVLYQRMDPWVSNLCILPFQENRYEEACQKFTQAMQVVGYKPDLSYNIALCHYMLKQYAPALKHIADIIERGIREHPGMIFPFFLLFLLFLNHDQHFSNLL